MTDFVPNEGEEKALQLLLNQNLFLGLMQNTPAQIAALGDTLVWANIVAATGFVGGNEKTLTFAGWTIPTGGSAGNPATYAQQVFTADVAGANNVSGYYIRTSDNKILMVGLNPEVEASGILKTMLAGAVYRVNPQYGAS